MTDDAPQEQPAEEEPQEAQPQPGIPEAVVWEKIGRLSLDNDLLRGRNTFLEGEVARLEGELEAERAKQNGAGETAPAATPPGPPAPPQPPEHRPVG